MKHIYENCQAPNCTNEIEITSKLCTNKKYCSKACSQRVRKNKYGGRYTTVNGWKHRGIIDKADGKPATEETFQRILKNQNGKCALCDSTENLCLDHEHSTGYVRGVLCHSHNRAIGIFGDDFRGIEKLYSYMLRHSTSIDY